MRMNLPNKITIARILLTIVIIVLLLFPFEKVGVSINPLFINESLVVEVKYLIAGALFIIASLTDFLDGHIARKRNLVTDFGKMTDAIADKMLVNSVLIILASQGFISAVIPVIIVTRDTVVDVIKMIAGNKGKVVAAIKSGKIKTACMMTGITLTLFYNLPFELIGHGIDIAGVLLLVATVLSVYSGIQYYSLNKNILFSEK